MKAKLAKDLMEAYASVYAQSEEIISEADCECEDEKSEKETSEMNDKKKEKKKEEKKEMEEGHDGHDIFDVILEHLVAEGYADTNEAALAIMANMSEEWKQSIVEQTARIDYVQDKFNRENSAKSGSAHTAIPGKQNTGQALQRAKESDRQMKGV